MSLAAESRVSSPAPLSTLLRQATAVQHARAETTPFITELMAGRLDRAAYLDLARQHHAIYAALEAAAEAHTEDPLGATFVMPQLHRTAALERDLTTLAGPGWPESTRLVPATERYAARLDEVAGRWSGFYLAHAYTRYLGDLSGGQVVRTMLERHYGLTAAELGFYHFAEIPKPKPFKDAYRSAMDRAWYTPEEKTAIAQECRVAFDLNTDLFRDLGEIHLR